MVPEAGYELRAIAVEGLSRSNPLKAAARRSRPWPRWARRGGFLRDVRPDAVLGAGGYVAGPVGLAAVAGACRSCWRGRQPSGPDNRLLARWARRVCLAFRSTDATASATSSPAPGAAARDRSRCRPRALRLAPDDTCVLVFGGSLGRAHDQRGGGAGAGRSRVRVLHACGARDYRRCARGSGPIRPANYDLREFIMPFGGALLASDLCVARAGGSIFEIAPRAPGILVPYPYASADHQSANARWMAQAGAAWSSPTPT